MELSPQEASEAWRELGQELSRLHAACTRWFGSAFARLACAPQLQPILGSMQAATADTRLWLHQPVGGLN